MQLRSEEVKFLSRAPLARIGSVGCHDEDGSVERQCEPSDDYEFGAGHDRRNLRFTHSADGWPDDMVSPHNIAGIGPSSAAARRKAAQTSRR